MTAAPGAASATRDMAACASWLEEPTTKVSNVWAGSSCRARSPAATCCAAAITEGAGWAVAGCWATAAGAEASSEADGRGGGAHSEYVQALSESGWPGLFCWLLLAAGSVALGIRVYLRTGRVYWLFLSLSLLSFFLHGLVNNFLHDARVAALVWGQVAMVVGRASRQE